MCSCQVEVRMGHRKCQPNALESFPAYRLRESLHHNVRNLQTAAKGVSTLHFLPGGIPVQG